MSALLGRDVTPERKRINSFGYELAIVEPERQGLLTSFRNHRQPTRKYPIFIANPQDLSVVSFSLYTELTNGEIRLLSLYDGVGTISTNSYEILDAGNNRYRPRVHMLRQGVSFKPYYFPTQGEVFSGYDMEHVLEMGDYVEEARVFRKRFDGLKVSAEGTLPLQSRK